MSESVLHIRSTVEQRASLCGYDTTVNGGRALIGKDFSVWKDLPKDTCPQCRRKWPVQVIWGYGVRSSIFRTYRVPKSPKWARRRAKGIFQRYKRSRKLLHDLAEAGAGFFRDTLTRTSVLRRAFLVERAGSRYLPGRGSERC